MYQLIKVLAKIELFSGKNMRQIPFSNKYRPAFEFKGARTKLSGSIDLIDTDTFAPGMSGIVKVTFIKGMIEDNYFKKGESFTISEGGKYALGKGEILEIVNDKEISSS